MKELSFDKNLGQFEPLYSVDLMFIVIITVEN